MKYSRNPKKKPIQEAIESPSESESTEEDKKREKYDKISQSMKNYHKNKRDKEYEQDQKIAILEKEIEFIKKMMISNVKSSV